MPHHDTSVSRGSACAPRRVSAIFCIFLQISLVVFPDDVLLLETDSVQQRVVTRGYISLLHLLRTTSPRTSSQLPIRYISLPLPRWKPRKKEKKLKIRRQQKHLFEVRVLAAFWRAERKKALGQSQRGARALSVGTMLFNASEEGDTIFNEQERSARGFVVV